VAGVCAYFDKCLAHCLLYRPERGQARGALAGGALPSSLYGGEHLLRLFVKMPELLPQVGGGVFGVDGGWVGLQGVWVGFCRGWGFKRGWLGEGGYPPKTSNPLNQVPSMSQDHLNALRTRLESFLTYLQERSQELFLPVASYADGITKGGGGGPRAGAAAGASVEAAAGASVEAVDVQDCLVSLL